MQGAKMKPLLLSVSFLLSVALMSCDDNRSPVDNDSYAPFPPVGIRSVTLDNAVQLSWIPNQESDVAGYNVYFSYSYKGRYDKIGSTKTASFRDNGARNGTTYYYAVTAFDYSDNESELSSDVVYDTPRPEGRNVALADRMLSPTLAGYDFSEYRTIHYNTDQTDVYFEVTSSGSGIPYLAVWKDSDIQDMGYTSSFDEISAAPTSGWNPTQDALAIKGHTYVIWTWDDHYAKIRITDVTPTAIVFDWGYQVAKSNIELFRGGGSTVTSRDRQIRARGH
jgi:hypothetical protein